MQAFRYQLPTKPRRSIFGRRPPSSGRAIAIVLAACGLGAGLWWGMPAGARAASSLSALLERPSSEAERAEAAETAMREGEAHLAKGELSAAVASFDRAVAIAADAAAWRRAVDVRYLLAASGAEAPALPHDAPALVAAAADARGHQRLDTALASYEAALAQDPRDARAHLGKAAVLDALGRGPEALAALDAAAEALPHDRAVTTARLDAIVRSGDDRRAIETAIAAYRPEAGRTDDEAVHVALIDAYRRQGLDPDELRDRLQADAPQLGAAARDYMLAGAAMRQYRRNPHWHRAAFDEVVSLARGVLATKGTAEAPWRARAGRLLAEAFALRAQGFVDRSDFEAARVQLAHAHEYARFATPEARAELHVQRARLLPLVGRGAEAIAELEAALTLAPGHPCRAELARWQLHTGVGLLAANRPKEAVKPLLQALAATPESAPALAWLVEARRRTGHASPLTASAKDAGLSLLAARVRLAEGLVAIGRRADAEHAAAEAARAGASGAELAPVRAELALAHGQRGQARTELLKAIEHRATGALWERLGAVESALASADLPARRRAHAEDAGEAFAHALAFGGSDALRGKLLAMHKRAAAESARHGDWAGSHRTAAMALTLAPGNAALALLDGDALARLGRTNAARTAFEAGLQGATPPSATGAALRQRLGRLALDVGHGEEAAKRYGEALSPEWRADAVTTAAAYYGLARACQRVGDREGAVEAAHQYLFWSFHDPEEARHVPEVQALESQLAAN